METTQQQPQTSTISGTPAHRHRTGWLDLPDELKLIILEYHLTFPKVLAARNYQIFLNMRLRPLRETKIDNFDAIVTEAFHKRNTFGITTNDFYNGLCPPASSSRNIRDLELTIIRLPDILFVNYVSPHHIWQNPRDAFANDEVKRTKAAQDLRSFWRNHFPRLRSLRLIFEISHVGYTGLVVNDDGMYHYLNEYVTAFTRAIADIEVETLTVTLLCSGFCPRKKTEHESGGCECTKELEANIAADMTNARAE